MIVTLKGTNNPGYKHLEGTKGELSINSNNEFIFNYKDKDGTEKILSSHVDGRLGELGDLYRSPEVVIKTGVCEFIFDQKATFLNREEYISTNKVYNQPTLITYEEYSKWANAFRATRLAVNNDSTNLAKQSEFRDIKNAFDKVALDIKKGKVLIVPNLNDYIGREVQKTNENRVFEYIQSTSDFKNIKTNSISCEKMEFLDSTFAVSVNNEVVATISNGELSMVNHYEKMEDAIKNSEKMNDYILLDNNEPVR